MEGYMNSKDVKTFLGIKSYLTLQKFMKQGLPFIKIDNRLYFKKAEVIKFMDNLTVKN